MSARFWLLDLHWKLFESHKERWHCRSWKVHGQRWMAIASSTSQAQCGQILLLPAPIYRRHLHRRRSSQGFILHGKSDFALHRSCVAHSFLVLSATWIRWKGISCHNNSSWFDSVYAGLHRKCTSYFGSDPPDCEVFFRSPVRGFSLTARNVFCDEGLSQESQSALAAVVPLHHLQDSRTSIQDTAVFRR